MIATLLLAAIAPTPRYIEETCDVIEVNHHFDHKARPVFDQVIFWELHPFDDEYHVISWRMMKDVRDPKQLVGPDKWPKWIGGHATPEYNFQTNRWVSTWWDQKDRKYRRVIAPAYRETWTNTDPEILDRKTLAQEHRRGLRK